ncbi:MAG: threonine/serine exporter family protein [Lachnospiraceae bacterium]|nr:threonine/serine exporter family protein [Lachnospiraceae bacterium]
MSKQESVEMHEVLVFVLEAGRILLKNGAEIFRVEETIEHICRYYKIDTVDTFIMSNGIFITAEQNNEEVFAKVKHVPLSGIHLGIVAEVNDLSREICAGKISLEAAKEKLKWIDGLPPKKSYFRVLAAGLGSGCFCFLLRANIMESFIAFVIGMILFIFVIFAERHKLSKIIVNIVGGAIITILAILATHIPLPILATVDKVIIGSILPLVPGVAFTNAIRDIANSDFISGTVRMIDALLVFVYIAIGVGVVLATYNNIFGGAGL